MAALGNMKSIAKGERVKLNDAAVAGTGTLDFVFVHQMNHPGDFSALFQVIGTLGSVSADLQVSLDGGTTFVTYSAAALVAATPFKLITLVDGAIWRLNITAGPTSADFWVTCN